MRGGYRDGFLIAVNPVTGGAALRAESERGLLRFG